jgi:hypothetical protein
MVWKREERDNFMWGGSGDQDKLEIRVMRVKVRVG